MADLTENKQAVIALDAMGGDFAPEEHVKGAVDAVNARQGFSLRLFGDQDKLNAELAKYQFDKNRIEIVHSDSVVENCDVPTVAIRKKKDSSMVMGLYSLKEDEAQAFISCGNTGALLVGGQTIVGRIKGIDRAGLAFLVPSKKGPVLMMDCGANVDCKPEMMVQFARMGSIYMETVLDVKQPKVGLVNIGEEESKGNSLVHESFPLLKECKDINFIGSVESRSITEGIADVVVCDGFTGNIILKTFEGVAAIMLKVIKEAMMKNVRTKIGAALVKGELKKSLELFSVEEYGGAPMLGIRKLIVKTHGNSRAPEIRNTILQCSKAVAEDLTGKMERTFYGI